MIGRARVRCVINLRLVRFTPLIARLVPEKTVTGTNQVVVDFQCVLSVGYRNLSDSMKSR